MGMGGEAMDITIRDIGDIVVFDIKGEILRSDVMETTLHQLVKGQLERGRRNFLLNLENVEFIDSFGVGEMLASYTSTQNLGGKIKLARISKKLGLVFKITWLDRIFESYDSEAAALQSFAKA
jgi:anti-sigma B factor antagonist